MSKYGAQKVRFNGTVFDSQKEAKRYAELRLLERAGEIRNLQKQKSFELIPAQYKEIPTGEVYKRGAKAGQKKYKKVCLEKSVNYIADFVYIDKRGFQVVEDTKGVRTKDYIIKRKLMLYVHGIRIKEI